MFLFYVDANIFADKLWLCSCLYDNVSALKTSILLSMGKEI